MTRRDWGGWRRFKRNKTALGGLFAILLIAGVSLCAPLISPYERGTTQNAAIRLQGPSLAHPFGADIYGRDIFTRVIHGGRVSLSLGIVAAALSMTAAIFLGSLAAYSGGLLDEGIMRLMDTLLCIPGILLSLAIVAALGPGIKNLAIALTVSYIPGFTRLVRSSALGIISSDYLDAARNCGLGELAILRRHVFRNILGPVVVQVTLSIGGIILQAAGLSFIGLGAQPPMPEWGAALSEAREFLRRAPHMALFPGAAIFLTALSFNLLGDGLRDALDPRFE